MTRKPANERELTMTTGSQGFKPCLAEGCGKFNAVKRSECVHCNNPFPKKSDKPQATLDENNTDTEVKDEVEVEYHTVSVYPTEYEYPDNLKARAVYAAAGECPFRLRSNDENALPAESAIRAWAFRVRQEIMNRDGTYLTNEALLRWARNEINADLRFKRDSEEMQYLRDVIATVPDVRLKKVAV
jgi:hypothetical protein